MIHTQQVIQMKYNKELDIIVSSKYVDVDVGSKLKGTVHSYNGGEKKLQVVRVTESKGEQMFQKLGRLTAKEFPHYIALLNDMKAHLGEIPDVKPQVY